MIKPFTSPKMGCFTSRVCCFQNQSNCTFLLYSSNSTKKIYNYFWETRKPYSFDIEYSALRSIHDKRTGFIFHITSEIRCHTVGVHLKLSTYTNNPNLLLGSGGKTAKYIKKYLRLPQNYAKACLTQL